MKIGAAQDMPTWERITRSLFVNGPSTAPQLAEKMGLTTGGIRRHLDQLVEDGSVEVREPRRAGQLGRGRPPKLFALTEEGREAFGQQYDDLAASALRFLTETAGEAGLREFAQRRATFIGRGFESVSTADPSLSPAQVLARVFSDAGYAASVRALPAISGHEVEQLCQQHCPVAHVAHEFPQLCEEETAAIARVLATHVQRLATIAHGDGVCTTTIPVGRRKSSTNEKEQVGA